jgi:hypothetical protein
MGPNGDANVVFFTSTLIQKSSLDIIQQWQAHRLISQKICYPPQSGSLIIRESE